MANLLNLEPNKSYKTKENAVKAFEKKYGDANLRYFVMQTDDGRYFPVCCFSNDAMQRGVHFHFNVVG